MFVRFRIGFQPGKCRWMDSSVCLLLLAEMELIFFTVAFMRLCFGFVLKTVLMITHQCSSYC